MHWILSCKPIRRAFYRWSISREAPLPHRVTNPIKPLLAECVQGARIAIFAPSSFSGRIRRPYEWKQLENEKEKETERQRDRERERERERRGGRGIEMQSEDACLAASNGVPIFYSYQSHRPFFPVIRHNIPWKCCFLQRAIITWFSLDLCRPRFV